MKQKLSIKQALQEVSPTPSLFFPPDTDTGLPYRLTAAGQ